MKFRCEHRFQNLTLAQYEELYFDEPFNVALCAHVQLNRTLISREVHDGRIRRVVKVGPEREIPAPAAKILGASKIEYTETLNYVFGSGRGEWTTVSTIMTDKVKVSGTLAFTQVGNDVTRMIEGDVTVKMMLVGGTVERFIVSDVEKSYDKAAEFTRDWLLKHAV